MERGLGTYTRGLRRFLVKGAEADLYSERWYGQSVVVKERVKKPYRASEIDSRIRRFRTAHEARLIHRAKLAGVATPTILFVDLNNATIIMELIQGSVLKDILPKTSKRERVEIFQKIGRSIAHLHKNEIIHGDLTTSNIIISPRKTIYFIDFGLASISPKIEDKAVDLHLIKTVLRGTHHRMAVECFDSLIDGYRDVLGEEFTSTVLTRIKAIERRGRYVIRA